MKYYIVDNLAFTNRNITEKMDWKYCGKLEKSIQYLYKHYGIQALDWNMCILMDTHLKQKISHVGPLKDPSLVHYYSRYRYRYR